MCMVTMFYETLTVYRGYLGFRIIIIILSSIKKE